MHYVCLLEEGNALVFIINCSKLNLNIFVCDSGDPDKSDQFGNTALHLAAAKGHLQCVDFLVKFGVNLFSLDIDRHTAKELAAINNRDDILRYLDNATAHLEQIDRKKSKSQKEQAEKQCEKRIKEYMKRQQKIEQTLENDGRPVAGHRPSTVLTDWKHRLWSSSQGNLKQTQREQISSNGTKFSELVGGTISGARGGVQRKLQQAIKSKQNGTINGGEFKVGEVEPSGKRSVRSLQGVQRDSEVIYVGTFSANDGGNRGKITDIFDMDEKSDIIDENLTTMARKTGTLSRSFSHNELGDEVSEEVILQKPYGIFNTASGTLTFR